MYWHRIGLPILLGLLLGLIACDSAEPGDGGDGPAGPEIVEGVNLDTLLRPPTADERAAVTARWARWNQQLELTDYAIVAEGTVDGASLQIARFHIDGLPAPGSSTGPFYGLIRHPTGQNPPGPLPMVLVLPADEVVRPSAFLTGGLYGALGEGFIQVLAVRPGQTLQALGATYAAAEFDGALYDEEVEVARLLLDGVTAHTDGADPSRLGIVGMGRGAAVGLLLAERPGVSARAVVALAGFADYRAPSFRAVLRQLLQQQPTSFPGGAVLDAELAEPLREGLITMETARDELLRRSPLYFAEALPPTLVFHGGEDFIIASDHSARLIDALQGPSRIPQSRVLEGVFHEDLFDRVVVQQAVAQVLVTEVADGG